MRIAFLVPNLRLAGGQLATVTAANHLARRGHQVSVIACIETATQDVSALLEPQVSFGFVSDAARRQYDVAVATFWPTVYELHRLRAARFVYFVQSLEHRFYRKGHPLRAAALRTYRAGIPFVTIADWIADWLSALPGSTARPAVVRYGMDKALFQPKPLPPIPPFRVLIEGALGTEIKNTELAIDIAAQSEADEVWLLTPSRVAEVKGVDRIFSGASRDQVASIMAQCHVLLKLSLVEGQPMPPVEMALSGRPSILSDIEPYHEYLEDGVSACFVAEPYREEVLAAIAALKRDEARLARMGMAARASVEDWPDGEASAMNFETALAQADPTVTGRRGVRALGAPRTPLGWLCRHEALGMLHGRRSRPLLFRSAAAVRAMALELARPTAKGPPSRADFV